VTANFSSCDGLIVSIIHLVEAQSAVLCGKKHSAQHGYALLR
jgi:uncharacterized membrane-anchored protein